MDVVKILLGIVGILALILVVKWILRATIKIEIVPEKERLAVYRLGRYHRVVGPGPVLLVRPLDKAAIRFDVTERPLELRVDGLFMVDVPMGVTLNLWCSFDPLRAIGNDREKLANLFQLSEIERRRQTEIKLREALVQELRSVTAGSQVPMDASLFEKIRPVIPGTPERERLLQQVKAELSDTLRPLGYVLRADEPITIPGLHPPDDVIDALGRRRVSQLDASNRGHIIEALQEQLPDLPDEMVAQFVASLEGREPIHSQSFLMEGNDNAGARLRVRTDGQQAKTRLTIGNRSKGRGQSGQEQPGESEEQEAAPTVPTEADEERLSKHDLSVLKRVPLADERLTGNQGRRLSA